MAGQLDYFNARVWGMRDSLLPEELHERLLSSSTLDSWVSALRETPYSAFLGPSPVSRDARSLYRAVDASVAARTRRLVGVTPGNPAKALRVCLAEQDLANLVAITSGIYNHADPNDILSGTLAGGFLGPEQIDALSRCRTLVEAADTLTTWDYTYQSTYRESLWKTTKDPQPKRAWVPSTVVLPMDRPLTDLRLDLNRNFTQILLADARKCGYPVISRFMREKVDRLNLMTTLMWRALPSDRDPMEFFLPGGSSVGEDNFRRMLGANDLSQVIAQMEPGPFRESAEKAAGDLGGQEKISLFESLLERKIIRRYTRPLALDPLGAELFLSYLLRLRLEGIRLKQSLTRLILDIPLDMFLELTVHG
ncbi:MAG: V-type ATPase subunit [Proteobacteria bacterium]|nr:V-type ATPase subunit [Pseudomonadota bacterium]